LNASSQAIKRTAFMNITPLHEPAIVHVVPRRVLPLQLSPLENMMMADDCPAYPMTFFVQLGLLGKVSLDAFAAATHDALDRHPLLRTLIAPHKANRPCWVEATDHEPTLDWAPEGAPINCDGGEAMDRTKEIGVRIWIRQGPQRATVLFQFHHANCDGTGAYRFIGDLLAGYGMRTGTTENCPTYGDVDAHLLRNRTRHTLNLAIGPARGFKRSALKEGWRIVSRRPVPLALPLVRACDAAHVRHFPGFVVFSFDRSEHRRLRDAANRYGVFLNDLLLRDLFLALSRWNKMHQGANRRRPICIMMPMDLRVGDDYMMPAANMTSYAFLCRDMKRYTAPQTLLESIRRQTAEIKHHRSATAWSDMAYAASTVPGFLPFLLRRNLCFATAVLSNAGDPSRRFTATFRRKDRRIVCGNMILEEITGVPPLRHNTRATFSISQYDNRLTISLRCDPHFFGVEDAQTLLQLYARQLYESAENNSRPEH
jgi:hypothetical protein